MRRHATKPAHNIMFSLLTIVLLLFEYKNQ